jgi:hypothetical protein
VSDQDRPGAQGASGPEQNHDVGSLGEEAAKLIGALSDWAQDHGADVGQGLGGLAGHAAASMRELNDHIATGSAECTFCPICRTVHAIRETSPEVRTHLVTAASSFLQAAAALLATQMPKDDTARTSHVERINLDDEGDGRGPGEV